MLNLNSALNLLKQGFSVFPLCSAEAPCPNKDGKCDNGHGKVPLVSWRQFENRLASEEEIRQWYKQWPEANIGVITGKISDIAVLDIDPRNGSDDSIKGKHLPVTPTQKTGGGGLHYFFKYAPGLRCHTALLRGVDFKADGGYVVIDPSVHPSGNPYRFFEGLELRREALAEVPQWITEQIQGKHQVAVSPQQTEEYVKLFQGVGEGKRNSSAAKLAGHLLMKKHSENEVIEILLGWNQRNKPPLEESEVVATVKSIVQTHARNNGQPANTLDGIKTIQLSTVTPQSVKWIRRNCWPQGKLSLVVGDPGLGKTFTAMDAAARLSTGAEWPEGGTAPDGSVIILTAEDGLADTIVPRLDAAGANREKIHSIEYVHVKVEGQDIERMFNLEEDINRLEKLAQSLNPIAIFIDPLSAYMGSKANTHRDSEVRRVLAPLSKLAEKYEVSVIGIMHLSKTQMKAIYKVNGSIAFVAAARSVFAVVPDPDDEESIRRFFAPIKMNLAPHPPALAFSIEGSGDDSKIKWEGTVTSLNVEAAIRGPEHGKRTGKNDAIDWLRNTLQEAGGELESEQIYILAEKDGISRSTVWRAKGKLGIKARKAGFGEVGQWFWPLPPAEQPPKLSIKRDVRPFEKGSINTHIPSKGLNETLTTPNAIPKESQNTEESKGSQVAMNELQCPACYGSEFWRRDDGGEMCTICHPDPRKKSLETEILPEEPPF